jgi:hypothetical protein
MLKMGRMCHCGGPPRVLIDIDAGGNPFITFALVVMHLEAAGYDVDIVHSGTTADYNTIFISRDADPSWWGDITGGGWTGRVILVGEYTLLGPRPAYTAWASEQPSGMSLVDDSVHDSGSVQTTNIAVDDLTDGVTTFTFGAAAEVSGGTPLIMSSSGSVPLISHNTIGTVDWVLTGDMNPFLPDWFGIDAGNGQFSVNCCSVPV